ncbi:unnamed protein product [Symbiodinium sp. CCMP2592]|nr:unnamed protein product [Symbiodinium sp. CCMP2592]
MIALLAEARADPEVRTRQGVSPLSLLMSSSVNAAAPDVFIKIRPFNTLRSGALYWDMHSSGFGSPKGFFRNAAMEPTQLAKPARKEFPETAEDRCSR